MANKKDFIKSLESSDDSRTIELVRKELERNSFPSSSECNKALRAAREQFQNESRGPVSGHPKVNT